MISYLLQDPAKPVHAMAEGVDQYGQLTKLASTFSHVDNLFYFTYVVCIFFFVLITGVLFYSVVKYRRKTFDQPAVSNRTHNTPLEVVWTVVPLIIVMVMFAWGWKGSLDMTVVPADARQYKALAKQWNWTFFYPNDAVPSSGELWLEVNKPAAFTLESSDVLHAFYMPSMRAKRDVVPGRLQTVWFQPTTEGEFHLFCAEYCGKDHSQMYAKVHVVSADVYRTRPWDTWDDKNPKKGGENLYKSLCASCHTINGTKLTGPTWKDLWGKQEQVVEAGQIKTVTVDEAYVIESIRKPDQKKVVGFEKANMTAFDDKVIDEKRVKGIIEYMKSLSNAGSEKK